MGLYLVYHDLIHSIAVVLGIVLLGTLHELAYSSYLQTVYTDDRLSFAIGWRENAGG